MSAPRLCGDGSGEHGKKIPNSYLRNFRDKNNIFLRMSRLNSKNKSEVENVKPLSKRGLYRTTYGLERCRRSATRMDGRESMRGRIEQLKFSFLKIRLKERYQENTLQTLLNDSIIYLMLNSLVLDELEGGKERSWL
jgi:hypothetical protein